MRHSSPVRPPPRRITSSAAPWITSLVLPTLLGAGCTSHGIGKTWKNRLRELPLRWCLPDPNPSTTTTATLYSFALVYHRPAAIPYRSEEDDPASCTRHRYHQLPSPSSTHTTLLVSAIRPFAVTSHPHLDLSSSPSHTRSRPLHNRYEHWRLIRRLARRLPHLSLSLLAVADIPLYHTPRDMGTLVLFFVANWLVNGQTGLIDGGIDLARSNERRGGRGQSVNGSRDDGGITRVDCVKDTGEVGTWVAAAEGEPARVKTGIDSLLQLAKGEQYLPSRLHAIPGRRAAIVGAARRGSSAQARRSSLTTTGSSLYPCAEGKDRATEDGESRDTPVSA
ncbi:hypothetical protein C8F01DRAFT_1332948 [Mycena amicta]|nr:hypothetical protein C8F01DRAFT_1332948 [Mycena amicta]